MASIPSDSPLPAVPSSYPASTNLPPDLNRRLQILASYRSSNDNPSEIARINKDISSKYKFNLLEGTVTDNKGAVTAKFAPLKKGESLTSMQETARRCIAFIEKQRPGSLKRPPITERASEQANALLAAKTPLSLKGLQTSLQEIVYNIKVFLITS